MLTESIVDSKDLEKKASRGDSDAASEGCSSREVVGQDRLGTTTDTDEGFGKHQVGLIIMPSSENLQKIADISR